MRRTVTLGILACLLLSLIPVFSQVSHVDFGESEIVMNEKIIPGTKYRRNV